MTVTALRCGICGRPAGEDDSQLVGGIWTPVTCSDCGRRRLLADGGLVVSINEAPSYARFDLGEIQIRPGALHLLSESNEHYWPFIERHVRGDAGSFRPEDAELIGKSFLNGSGNIVSEYRTQRNRRLWVITEPGKVTLVLAPGEF